ncbi:methyl-accepting chemotaxis, putative [Babesia ovata]|uniref:Methyl-accepting chemotaxis, putative n=1 Tax=Babesia ovata TaxID=189622 RepID=A0A2H6KHB3_9APIC|nr:methyl-accepting chemotaxis, putative [Babesia ovata]GBE62387.1 methyl-accepting chemotaxis, putative [Babesia ovata]
MQFAPDMITVKRLVCDDIRRKCVNNAIEHLCEAAVTSTHSHIVDVWRSWRHPAAVDTPTYPKSGTHLLNTGLREATLPLHVWGKSGLKHSPSEAVERNDHSNGNSKPDGEVRDNGFKTNSANYKVTAHAMDEGIHVPDDVAIALCGRDGKNATLPRRIVGAADLVTHTYSISGLIRDTGTFRKLTVEDLHNMEFLHSETRHEVVRPRLSNPFSLYNGTFNRTALENLREWSNLDVLKNRM